MEGDRRFRALTRPEPNGQTLWMYLLTGRHTQPGLPGLYETTAEGLASRLGWSLRGLQGVWGQLGRTDEIHPLPMALADWEAGVVWLPRAINYNLPENVNIVKGWTNGLDAIPECDLRDAWLINTAQVLDTEKDQRYVEPLVKWFGKPLPKGFPKGLPKPFPNRQQQQQQQQQQQTEVAPHLPLEGTAPTIDRPVAVLFPVKEGDEAIYQDEVAAWQELYGNVDVLAKVKHMVGHWSAKTLPYRKTAKRCRLSITAWLAKDDHSAPTGGRYRGKVNVYEGNEEAMRKMEEQDGHV